jgi:predicted AAA+ superfamily ATPase
MIKRGISRKIIDKLELGKAILLFGPRQTGKTTLLHQLFDDKEGVLWLNGDEADVQKLFEAGSSTRLLAVFGRNKTIVVDEAQRITNIGLTLKLITDELKQVQVIATGSSAFELASRTQEPLTGRKWEYFLYPLSFEEMVVHHGLLEEKRWIYHRLVFGSYPEVVNNPGTEKEVLKLLTDSFLYKDILMVEGLKKPLKIVQLLQALALQIGNEVSYNELGRTVGLDNQTVERYIDLLEKVFIIFRVTAFSRNLRKELKRSRKIYFYDNGVRNALIAQFNPIELRVDRGVLWENYLMAERKKYIEYNGLWVNSYFWRTQDQQEIDYLEESDGLLKAWEFKWSPNKTSHLSKTFANAYPNSEYKVITTDNMEEFLLL